MDQALYNQYYNQLGNVYNPQVANLTKQRAGIAEDSKAALSGLEQAKINAFRDITDQSSTRGMLFSGFRPDAQATYIGEKYLPAVAGVKTSQRNALTSLQEALNQVNAQRSKDAMGLYQNDLDRRQSASNSAAAASVVDPYKGFNAVVNKVDGKSTGTSFFGPGNQPITAGQYYSATGTGLQGLANFLRNDQDKTSQKAYKELTSGKYTPQQLTKKYPWIFGGV